MLNKEVINELLNIKTSNTSNDRFLKIMQCNNPIKTNYIFHLKEIKKYFNLSNTSFEENIIYSIYKYDIDLSYNLKINNLVKNRRYKIEYKYYKTCYKRNIRFLYCN